MYDEFRIKVPAYAQQIAETENFSAFFEENLQKHGRKQKQKKLELNSKIEFWTTQIENLKNAMLQILWALISVKKKLFFLNFGIRDFSSKKCSILPGIEPFSAQKAKFSTFSAF